MSAVLHTLAIGVATWLGAAADARACTCSDEWSLVAPASEHPSGALLLFESDCGGSFEPWSVTVDGVAARLDGLLIRGEIATMQIEPEPAVGAEVVVMLDCSERVEDPACAGADSLVERARFTIGAPDSTAPPPALGLTFEFVEDESGCTSMEGTRMIEANVAIGEHDPSSWIELVVSRVDAVEITRTGRAMPADGALRTVVHADEDALEFAEICVEAAVHDASGNVADLVGECVVQDRELSPDDFSRGCGCAAAPAHPWEAALLALLPLLFRRAPRTRRRATPATVAIVVALLAACADPDAPESTQGDVGTTASSAEASSGTASGPVTASGSDATEPTGEAEVSTTGTSAPPDDTSSDDTGPPEVADGIWISVEEIMALPMAGPAWEAMLADAMADPGMPDLSDQDQDNNVLVLARAFVCTRLEDEAMCETVREQVMAAVGTEGDRTLPLGRELMAYVICADVVGLSDEDDATFSAWLADVRHVELGGRTLISTHEDRPNNWGTHAGASRLAAAVYLDDEAELQAAADVFQGYLGARDVYAEFSYEDLWWQADPDAPVGINPVGAMIEGNDVDGVLPDDQRRAGPFVWPPPQENYVYEALQGALAQAVILHRRGYDVWSWEDEALRRAFTWLHDQADFPATGDDSWQPYLVNYYYGSDFPAPEPSSPGKNVGYTDWTHASP